MPPADPAERRYDVYRELFRITEWRGGAIYRTKSQFVGWFPMEDVDANVPALSGLLYVAASDEFARNNMTIRTRKE